MDYENAKIPKAGNILNIIRGITFVAYRYFEVNIV